MSEQELSELAVLLRKLAISTKINLAKKRKVSPLFADQLNFIRGEVDEVEDAYSQAEQMSKSIPLFTAVEDELAYIILATLHLSAYFDLRIGEAVMSKFKFNKDRVYK